jgi:hypothetical protein
MVVIHLDHELSFKFTIKLFNLDLFLISFKVGLEL